MACTLIQARQARNQIVPISARRSSQPLFLHRAMFSHFFIFFSNPTNKSCFIALERRAQEFSSTVFVHEMLIFTRKCTRTSEPPVHLLPIQKVAVLQPSDFLGALTTPPGTQSSKLCHRQYSNKKFFLMRKQQYCRNFISQPKKKTTRAGRNRGADSVTGWHFQATEGQGKG